METMKTVHKIGQGYSDWEVWIDVDPFNGSEIITNELSCKSR